VAALADADVALDVKKTRLRFNRIGKEDTLLRCCSFWWRLVLSERSATVFADRRERSGWYTPRGAAFGLMLARNTCAVPRHLRVLQRHYR